MVVQWRSYTLAMISGIQVERANSFSHHRSGPDRDVSHNLPGKEGPPASFSSQRASCWAASHPEWGTAPSRTSKRMVHSAKRIIRTILPWTCTCRTCTTAVQIRGHENHPEITPAIVSFPLLPCCLQVGLLFGCLKANTVRIQRSFFPEAILIPTNQRQELIHSYSCITL